MGQGNVNEDRIINMSFIPKYFDWFIMQSKKLQLAQQCDVDIVDVGNVTQYHSLYEAHMRLALDV